MLLGHMVTACLIIWEIARLFSKVVVLFYIPTNIVWGFQFFHILTNISYLFFKKIIIT